jgi:transglutaminase-like putative cysteine protease
LPPGLEATLLKADRTNWVSLSSALAGQTNHLVVVVWGHGGKQGNAAVFHVRGPRLTPADFKKLAGSSAASESDWILFFRGSGAFASQIAGEHRRILSSERDTMFASDPVGMSLVERIVRAKPLIGFQPLAEELGRATSAWYKDRNLARTEEPTLWLEPGTPRLLAASAEEDSFASVKTEDLPSPSAAEKQHEPDSSSAGLPAVWKEIKKVEAQKYRGNDAVMLRRRLGYTFGSSPAIASEQEEFIQILTPEGKRFGDFDISYSPPYEDINFLDCEVLRPDGKIARLDPDAIRETREESVGDYQMGRRKFFSLPGIVPGAVLHVRYRTEWKSFPLPHISLEIPTEVEVPVVDSTLQVAVPKETPFHFASMPAGERGAAPADPVIKQTGYGAVYSWHAENLPAETREVLASPGRHSRLMLSTFPDWRAFADWYGRISRLTDEVTPEIAAKAGELTGGAQGEREQVLALYNYVTRLRYVAVPLGVNSFRPHAAANVLQNQFGDCKDKANLFNALLHSLKIKAELVLVPRFSQAYDALPGFAFNHAISRVTLGEKTFWVDTTDDVCRFGMLPPGDYGRKVLVIEDGNIALSQLPLAVPGEHQLKLHGEVNCSGAGNAWPATFNATGFGYPDYELRATASESRQHAGSPPLLAARFRPAAGSFALEDQTGSSVAALDENFSWRAEGQCVGISAAVAGKRSLRAPFWIPKEWDLALHRRKAPLFLNRGYPLLLREELEFKLPSSGQSLSLPGMKENKEPPLRWRIEWAKLADDKLAANFSAECAVGELPEADTKVFQQQLSALLAALAESASFSAPP